MCGINGLISNAIPLQDVEMMNNALQHRGPDAQGTYYAPDHHLALGHRRLSILDVTEAGNQPFQTNDGAYAMVFNGEIYNYKALAKAHQIETTSNSDTEVIFQLLIRKGPSIVEEFNGMFAIAFWNQHEQSLTLFRDRLGIKPLFYTKAPEGFFFSSEIKAIKTVVPLHKEVGHLTDFLYLGYAPQNHSFYKDLHKLPAGAYMQYKDGQLTTTTFWSAEEQLLPHATVQTEAEAKEALRNLLLQSVECRMIADVPLGTFLSGGTDSSTVTAIAQSLSDKPIKTFSIGFKEAKFNEAKYAAQVAKHLGTDHHEFMLSEQDALDRFDDLLNTYDEPFADASYIPTLLVSQMTRQKVTVALSGDGGDELFMGYGMYAWARRLNHPVARMLKKPMALALETSGKSRLQRAAELFKYPDQNRLKSHIFSQEQYFFTLQEIDTLLLEPRAEPRILENNPPQRNLSPAEAQAFFDLKNYLKDDLLVKVDRASMAHSLEVRVPLLDHNVVAFALNLNEALKWKNGEQKYLLKQVLYDYVPKSLFDRPKWGFGVPLIQWLKNDWRYLIEKYLSKTAIEETGLFNYTVVNHLVQRYLSGQTDYLYNRIWLLIIAQAWLLDK